MKIILDAMGSDNHPEPEISAAVEAVKLFGDEITLVGREEQISARLNAVAGDFQQIKIVHAAEIVTMTDKPAENARRKSDNSMAIGMDLVKSGEADAFITAGNTGGAMANALFRLGRIRGVKRPALTALFPVKNGHCAVLDIGANADCKPEYLLQFAHLGAVYTDKVLRKQSPRIGLLSNGEEAGKGNNLVKQTFPLLLNSGLNFIGNVEGKELFGGQADVVVTDGFTGNVLLKTSEAVAVMITDILKEELTSSLITKIGALLAKPAFGNIKKLMDPGEVGAIPLLGIDGLVFVGHGRSDAHALVNGIRVARQAVEADLLTALKDSIKTALA
ncbi:MAG: phosphate acyltransferase PlsX [Anaerolineales bacterium]|nr:phosphate acyltransferase PlsX [Anaerolineales bacterium]